jgi:hypothetical protein
MAETGTSTDAEIFGKAVVFGDQQGGGNASDNALKGAVNFENTESSLSDKAITFGQNIVGSGLQTSGIVSGALTGFKLSAPLVHPIPRGIATVVGAGMGFFAGDEARKAASEINVPGTDVPFTGPAIEKLPPDQRAMAVAGQAIGGGTPVSATTVGLAKFGFQFSKSFVGNFFNRILKNARETTGTFLKQEAAGLTGAATGGFLAEKVLPGNLLARFGGEIGFGIVNPMRIVLGMSNKIKATYQRGVQALSSSAREGRAAEVIGDLIEESGGDPILLARLLEANGLSGIGPQTAAAKVGGDALAEFQAQLMKLDGKFSAEAKAMTEANLNNLDAMIRAMRSTGDPRALKAVAELESQKFRAMITGRLAAAEREIIEDVQKISSLTPEARTQLSTRAKEIIIGVKTVAREAESALWKKIPGHIRVKADDLIEEHFILSKELAATGESLPKPIEFFIKKLNAEGADGTVSMAEMIAFRKRALTLARDAAAQPGGASDASAYGKMAEAVLDSMDTTFGQPGEGVNRTLGLAADAYHTARGFSREFNDAFTRTFAGHSLKKTRTGANAVPAEVMLQRALASGGDEAAMRLRELEEATRFMEVKGLANPQNSDQIINDMMEAQENMVRIMSTKYIDPLTGRVSPKTMANFVRENPQLMKRFPELKKDLNKAIKSEVDFQNMTVAQTFNGRPSLKDASRIVHQQAAFAEVAKLDNSVVAVKNAINATNPEQKLNALVKLANKRPAQAHHAREGLRSSVYDHVLDQATLGTGRLNYAQIRAAFFEPLQSGGKKSLMDIMQKTGIMDSSDIKRLNTLLDEGDKLGQVSAATGRADEGALTQEVDVLTDLLTRVTGAVASSRTAKYFGFGGQGPSLIIAGAGSRAAQRAMNRVPQAKIRDVFIAAATDPKFMAMLLRKPRTSKEAVDFNRQIHAYLVQAHFIPLRNEADEDEELPLPSGS